METETEVETRKLLLKKDRKLPGDLRVMSAMLPVPAKDMPPDFRVYEEPITDQDGVGLCFGFAAARSFGVTYQGRGRPPVMFSPMFVGNVTRDMEGSLSEDAGASLGDAFDCLVQYGIVPETEFPFDPQGIYAMPPDNVMAAALDYQALQRYRLPIQVPLIKQTLCSGFAVAFGTDVYKEFMTVGRDGRVPNPNPATSEFEGRHALVFTGWDDNFLNLDGTKGALRFANSWGIGKWSEDGFGWLSYQYAAIPGILSDLQVVSKTEIGRPLNGK